MASRASLSNGSDPVPDLGPRPGAGQLGSAPLGLPAATRIEPNARAHRRRDGKRGPRPLPAALQTALWPATWGYYLDQTAARSSNRSRTRRSTARSSFFVDFVRAQGPLPALRIGRQPYGLLPVMALDESTSMPFPDVDRFVEWVRALRGAVRSAAIGAF